MSAEALGDGDDRTTEEGREAQRDPPLQPTRVITAAVHCEQVRNAHEPRRPSPISGHGEFVTVHQVDVVASERVHELTHEGDGGQSRAKQLNTRAGPDQLASDPPFSSGGRDNQVLAAGRLELGYHAYQHTFRASRAVRLDEGRETETEQ